MMATGIGLPPPFFLFPTGFLKISRDFVGFASYWSIGMPSNRHRIGRRVGMESVWNRCGHRWLTHSAHRAGGELAITPAHRERRWKVAVTFAFCANPDFWATGAAKH